MILIDTFPRLLEQVTASYVIRLGLYHNRIHLFTDVHDIRTASVKTAPLRYVDRAGDFSGGFDLLGLG